MVFLNGKILSDKLITELKTTNIYGSLDFQFFNRKFESSLLEVQKYFITLITYFNAISVYSIRALDFLFDHIKCHASQSN